MGARQIGRVKMAQRKIFLLCLVYTGLMTAAAWLGGKWFVQLFTNDAAIAEKALWAIRVYLLSLLPLGIQYEIVDGFTAIGKVQYSLPLSFWRKLVYFAALFLLPAIWGAESAFFAEPISDVAYPLVSIMVYLSVMKKVLDKKKKKGSPTPSKPAVQFLWLLLRDGHRLSRKPALCRAAAHRADKLL